MMNLGMFGNKTLAPPTFQPGGGGFNNQGSLNLTAKSNQNLDIIVEGVKKDMQEWQSCKIWPYSCYGPVGGKPCVPGFDDLSPEEFRLAFMQNGNMLPPEMSLRFQQIQQLRMNYQQSTLENRNTIERIATLGNTTQSPFGGQAANTQPQQAGIFKPSANPQAGSIFGGGTGFGATQQPAQPTSSIFGGSSLFGTTPANTFGQPQTSAVGNTTFQTQPSQASSIFGGGAQQQTQGQSAFGVNFHNQQQPASLFPSLLQQQQQQTGLFQSQTPSQGTGGLFQQPNPTSQPQGSLFQQQPSLFNPPATNQPQPSLFQQPAQPQLQQPGQLQQPPTGLFQIQQQPTQTNTSLFAQPQSQPSLFAPSTGSIFGGGAASQQQQPAPAAAGGIFGGSTTVSTIGNIQQQGSGMPGAQKCVYSNETELSPEDLESFKAAEFTVDSIPNKPPPQSLCL